MQKDKQILRLINQEEYAESWGRMKRDLFFKNRMFVHGEKQNQSRILHLIDSYSDSSGFDF
jgi:hypothetical protein